MSVFPLIRPAAPEDKTELMHLLQHAPYLHRHLDWHHPLDWLGSQAYWLAQDEYGIQAILACPASPPDIAWIRLFAVARPHRPAQYWQSLFNQALQSAPPRPITFALLALQEWAEDLASASGFHHHQDIVVLRWEQPLQQPHIPLPAGVHLRPLQAGDLSAVAEVDRTTFEPLWQNPLDALELAWQSSSYSTVLEYDGQIIAYQISTTHTLNAHLARLAVDTRWQRHGLARALVVDMFNHFTAENIWQITVNTQSDNRSSLALYEQVGFVRTGETFPVFTYHWPKQP